MQRLSEFFELPNTEQKLPENSSSLEISSTTLESSLYNLMENFEQTDVTDSPALCKLHMPTWLNMWCVIITISVLAILITLGVLVRQAQSQRRRHTRTECYHCIAASPDIYSEHFLDRGQILVY